MRSLIKDVAERKKNTLQFVNFYYVKGLFSKRNADMLIGKC